MAQSPKSSVDEAISFVGTRTTQRSSAEQMLSPSSGGEAHRRPASGVQSAEEEVFFRYEDLGLIGRGGMGEVRRVRDRVMDRILAMKILVEDLSGSTQERTRFLEEARMTASLQHPGIVPVHDCGELPDGRLWFTMKEVRGRTLNQAIVELYSAEVLPSARSVMLRRLLELFARACEAVAYAHSLGVIHRDLKPENIMLGEFGEVLVLDWGLARPVVRHAALPSEEQPEPRVRSAADTQPGEVLGTFAYMSPEQARGELARVGPTSDVYALGCVLYEILAARPPYVGDALRIWTDKLNGDPPPVSAVARYEIPSDLAAVCMKAITHDPGERFLDAGALGEKVRGWLDGANRHERALAVVAEAREMRPRIVALQASARALRGEAGAVLARLRSFDATEKKVEAWRLEDRAIQLEREASIEELTWLQTLRSALREVPDLPEAHADLSDHHHDCLVEAEQARDVSGVERNEALLRVHDRGRYAGVLSGMGALSVTSEPAGAEVSLHRYVERDRRLVAEYCRALGRTPLRAVPLPHGSYLLVLRAPGRQDLRYPVMIGRGEHWDGIRPGSTGATPLQLSMAGALNEDELHVPAGWFISGGDTEAGESLPRRRLWVDDLVIQKYPVTNEQFLEFLNDLVAQGRSDEADLACPRRSLGHAEAGRGSPVFERAGDRFRLAEPGEPDELDWPVAFVDWHGALAYGAWLSRRTGHLWRLPNEIEWEKAARGVDGRFMPWGDMVEPTWACVLGSHEGGRLGRVSVKSYPTDESVYGVRGLVGNVRDWCINAWSHQGPTVEGGVVEVDAADPASAVARAARGGAWMSSPSLSRPASRFVSDPDYRFGGLGFRLVRAM